MFPWWIKKIHNGEIIHIADVSAMPPEASNEKEILEMQDISSLIVLPLYIGGKISGFVGMDNVASTGTWSEEDIQTLGTLATLVGNAIERSHKEEALKTYSAELESAYEELKSLDRMKNELIANLSHELKTPLNSIYGYSSILDQGSLGELNEEQKKSINIVLNSSVRLSNLIDSLLYLGNVLAGKMEHSMDILLIENIINQTIGDNIDKAAKKQITISKKLEAEYPFVEADIPSLIKLMNILMDNAIKFTPEGGKIDLSTYGDGNYIHIEVQDTGIGVPKDKRSKVFENFYQVDGSATRKYGGNGLGLYVAKLIVEAHKGKIWIESEVEIGTTVHVLLPLKQGS